MTEVDRATRYAAGVPRHAEGVTLVETGVVSGETPGHDSVLWRCATRLEKREGDWTQEQIDRGEAPDPYEILESVGNLLMTQGANDLWTALTTAAGLGSGSAYTNANSAIGVGDSTTVEAVGQTDLQAATNKVRVAMNATYPIVSTNTCQFQSTFGTGTGNFQWQEWGIFNNVSGGHMLNRKVQNNGTKASGSTWTFTVTLTLQ